MQFNIFKFFTLDYFSFTYFNAILLEVYTSCRVRVNSSKENQDFETSRQYLFLIFGYFWTCNTLGCEEKTFTEFSIKRILDIPWLVTYIKKKYF